eukprot:363357-Chlamydomonas_euryale.AAC.24
MTHVVQHALQHASQRSLQRSLQHAPQHASRRVRRKSCAVRRTRIWAAAGDARAATCGLANPGLPLSHSRPLGAPHAASTVV